MNIFAKIFMVGDDQVLVTKEHNDDPEKGDTGYIVNVRFKMDHIGEANQSYAFDDEDLRDKGFDAFDENMAKLVHADVHNLFKDLVPEGDNNDDTRN